jgi:hypothetical protein
MDNQLKTGLRFSMMKIIKLRFLSVLLLLISLPMLTACPGVGDSLKLDEESTVTKMGDNVCFSVSDAEDYQPVDIAIDPRGTRFRDQRVTVDPPLYIENGLLCIPPSFYRFPDKGIRIVSFVLHAERHKNSVRKFSSARRIVAGVEMLNGYIYNIPLTDMETLRPYSERIYR